MDWDYGSSADLDDGQWHSISVVAERLNQTTTNPNYRIDFWIDDWDMSGSATMGKNMYVTNPGSDPFRMAALFVNYGGAANPTNEHAIEYDDFEVWNGLPT